MDVTSTLVKIMSKPHLHALWLNSLSYLEYRGFRKIVRSQQASEMNLERMRHSLEEVRHAIFFKRQALRLGGNAFDLYQNDTLLCALACKKYFYDVDAGAALLIRERGQDEIDNAAYYIITRLVEERALAIYGVYDRLLRELDAGFSVTAVLRDEDAHLQEVIGKSQIIMCRKGLSIDLFKAIEDSAFVQLWSDIEKFVQDLI